MDYCSAAAVKDLCARYGFSFQKSLGQNFLVNPEIPARIAAAAAPDGETAVLEIGPGFGALTDALAASAAEVTALELDRALLPVLAETLRDRPNVRIVQGDVLKTDLAALCGAFRSPKRIAVANLPYYITTKSVLRLLTCGLFSRVCVMIQREAAAKLTCGPGSADWCLFSLLAHRYAEIAKAFSVGRNCFMPQPGVESTVLRMDCIPRPDPAEERAFTALARALFASRRKTVSNTLGALCGGKTAAEELARRAGVNPAARGEALTPEQVAALARLLPLSCGEIGENDETLS